MPYPSLLFKVFPKVFTLICFPCYKWVFTSRKGCRYRRSEAERTQCPHAHGPPAGSEHGMNPIHSAHDSRGIPLTAAAHNHLWKLQDKSLKTVGRTGHGLQNHNLALYLLLSDYTNGILWWARRIQNCNRDRLSVSQLQSTEHNSFLIHNSGFLGATGA